MAPGSSSDDRESALLEVVSSIIAKRTISELFSDLIQKLARFVPFDRLALLLHDPEQDVIVLKEVFSSLPHNAPVGMVYPINETPASEVIRGQTRFFIDDVATETRYPLVLDTLRAEQLRTFCYLPLSSPTRRLGALGFGTRADLQYSDDQLNIMERAMTPVAVAVENILNREQVERERDRLKLMLQVSATLVTKREPPELFDEISRWLQPFLPHEFITVSTWDQERSQLLLRHATQRDPTQLRLRDLPLPLDSTPSGKAFTAGAPQVFDSAALNTMASIIRDPALDLGIESMCSLPLKTARGRIGAMSVGTRQRGAFHPAKVAMLQSLAEQVAVAVENTLAFARVEELNRRLNETRIYLEEELQTETSSDEILGVSPGIRNVLRQIETVATTDATVLITGETGCGKELVARAVHQKSLRSHGTFVKLNCAAIPTGLLESELFGHERGAFTGAIAQKIGRCEIAHQGTLFLDEIGEVPLELQPKLLRFLQEKEFERLGGVRTFQTDARLVAATNRDLKKLAETNQFRSDLFYRLNVFPIHVPPLRERREDIPHLAMHFTQIHSRRLGRNIQSIPSGSIDRLVRYHWPGNIRELQNLMERSVILSTGDTLRIPLQELEGSLPESFSSGGPSGTMEDVERQTILHALRESKGVVGGAKGAAAKLGMKRTTLLYRMDKLGISNPG